MKHFLIPSLIALLSACASQTPPVSNAYCRLYQRLPDPADAVNLKKRENKLAVLTNEQTWLTECGYSGSLRKGPT
jgi:hypothetical protein